MYATSKETGLLPMLWQTALVDRPRWTGRCRSIPAVNRQTKGKMTNESLPTVTKNPHAYLPSTWRDPICKLLTSRKIAQYQREGWYGGQAALRARTRMSDAAKGIVLRCTGCGSEERLKRVAYAYLPTPGYWCLTCIARHRKVRDQAEELKERYRKAAMTEYE